MSGAMYNKLKQQNGERFAKSIRNYDNGILEIKDLDKIVKYAGRTSEEIMYYLIAMKNIQIEEHGAHLDPLTLLDMAGYDAFYADTEEKKDSIKKYFHGREELCTFRDKKRHQDYHIIHCVKKNIDEIKRDDFMFPMRQDEYGVSVISIQISKKGGFISIKNRYNHSVEGCDNTFGSNPDNIIEGLSASLKHKFGIDFSSRKVNLPANYIFMDSKILKYNYEINNVYIGENFYAKDGQVFKINTQKEIMLDSVIFNLQTRNFSSPCKRCDNFVGALYSEIKGKSIQIIKNTKGNKCLEADGVEIVELNEGKIVSLHLPSAVNIAEYGNFLFNNKYLSSLSLPNVTHVGNNFLNSNKSLETLSLPNLTAVGDNFLYQNQCLKEFNAPKLKYIKSSFLFNNQKLKNISLPEAEYIEHNFLHHNQMLENLYIPKSCYMVNLLEMHPDRIKLIDNRDNNLQNYNLINKQNKTR